MSTTKSQEELVKASIPRQLYMAVVRVQATHNLDWESACGKAAELVDSNSVEFKKAVSREAQRLHKAKFLEEMNRARLSIHNSGFLEGEEWVRANEDSFRAPCSICGKPMRFSSNDNNWEQAKPTLHGAFAQWAHTTCRK
jgi:hypothetical protein